MGGGHGRNVIDHHRDAMRQDEIGRHDVASRDIVVVGASAGGVEALQALVRGFPADLAASVFVVLHIPRRGPRALAAILDRAGPLTAVQAEDGDRPAEGRIYVASSDHHLVLADGRIRLTQDAAVNGHRPSIDALFRSAAACYGHRVIAVVLSGAGDDGAAGLLAAAQAGAASIVQDPDQAGHPSMPRRAWDLVPNALMRRAEEIGPLVAHLLVAGQTEGTVGEIGPAAGESGLKPLDLEGALWLAMRALQEKAALNVRMAASRRSAGDDGLAARYLEQAEESNRAADAIRRYLRSPRAAGVGQAAGVGRAAS